MLCPDTQAENGLNNVCTNLQEYSGVKRESNEEYNRNLKREIYTPGGRNNSGFQPTFCCEAAYLQCKNEQCELQAGNSCNADKRVETVECNAPECCTTCTDSNCCNNKVWKCHICAKQFSQKHHLQTHLLCHSGVKRYECPVCHKSFKQQAHLSTHLLIHEGRRPHRCSQCDHSFSQVTHLKRHMVTHGGSTCLSCSICGRRFAFPSDLSAHINKHHNTGNNMMSMVRRRSNAQQLHCEVCERVFQYPSQLRDHMLVHTQVRRFACQVCGMRFMKEHHLRAHQITHSSVKPFACPICGRCFSLKANMERHVFIHNSERRFSCEQCGKKFSQPQTLKMHMVSHAEVKPYSCNVCGKGLARAHNLRAHMAIHQNSKPHKCTDCNSTFTLKGNLMRHLKEKHGAVIPAIKGQNEDGDGGKSSDEAVESNNDSMDAHPSASHSDQQMSHPDSDSLESQRANKRRKNPPKRLKKFGDQPDSDKSFDGDMNQMKKFDGIPPNEDMSNQKYENMPPGQPCEERDSDHTLPPNQTPPNPSRQFPVNTPNTNPSPTSPDHQIIATENCLEVNLTEGPSRPPEMFTNPPYYQPPAGVPPPEISVEHKPFTPFHPLQPHHPNPMTSGHGHGHGHHHMFGAGMMGSLGPPGYYSDQSILPIPGPHACHGGTEEVGVRLQALHAAIDDLAGKLGPSHDKVTALHTALDELASAQGGNNCDSRGQNMPG